LTIRDLAQTLRHHTLRLAVAGVLVPVIGLAGQVGADAHASVNTGYGWAYINGLNQQGQWNGYYCGPAVVSEASYTEGVPVDQGTAAAYMGTTSNGTDTGAFTAGMQHFVGVPTYGSNWYIWVNVPYTPSSSDMSTFVSHMQFDISPSYGSVLGGDAWEVAGGPHLVGHPNQTIFHYFEIGGWNTNNSTTYYADSATSVWSTVPAYSWFDTWTMVVILGGRGYVW